MELSGPVLPGSVAGVLAFEAVEAVSEFLDLAEGILQCVGEHVRWVTSGAAGAPASTADVAVEISDGSGSPQILPGNPFDQGN